MDRGRPQIEKGKHSFSFQDFFKLIKVQYKNLCKRL